MNFSLEDFIPEILDPEDDDFSYRLACRYEFARYGANATEKTPEPGHNFPHQDFSAFFYSLYKRGLVIHQPGTGKTCLATAVAETLKFYHLRDEHENISPSAPIVYIIGMPSINANFMNEIVCRCTNNEYIDSDDPKSQTVSRVNAALRKYYRFMTLNSFSKFLSFYLEDDSRDYELEGHLFIIDEVHNFVIESAETGTRLRDRKERKEVYNKSRDIFMKIPSIKVLLLSGTPMRNTPNELASILNMILPEELQILDITSLSIDEIWERFKGRISYLRETRRNFKLNYLGVPISSLIPTENLRNLVVPCPMREFQKQIYYQVLLREGTRKVYSQVRQSAILVYPDRSYSNNSFSKFIQTTGKSSFTLTPEFERYLDRNSPSAFVESLSNYSAKFAYIADYISKNPTKKGIIYQEFKYQGVFPLSALISWGLDYELIDAKFLTESRESRGYCGATDENLAGTFSKKNRIAFLVPSPNLTKANREALISIFNSKENYDGSIIRWLIFSPVGREGLSFKDVVSIITDSSWSFSIDEQARRRGIRANSHNEIILHTPGELVIDIIQLSIDLGVKDNLLPTDEIIEEEEEAEAEEEESEAEEEESEAKAEEEESEAETVEEGEDLVETAERIGDEIGEISEEPVNIESINNYRGIYNIDLYMYVKAERKEKTIRPYIRLSKEMAYDGFVHRRRNQQDDLPDYSIDCGFQSCRYDCYSAGPEEGTIKKYNPMKLSYPMDYSWFWRHPDLDVVKRLTNVFKDYFHESNLITFEQLMEMENIAPPLIKSALLYMAEKMETFENRLGYRGFLAFSDSAVALVPRPSSKFEEYLYFENFRFQIPEDSIKKIIDPLIIDETHVKLDRIFREPVKTALKFISTTTATARNYLLEKAFTLSDNPVADAIIDRYRARLFDYDDIVVSTMIGIDYKQKHSLVKNLTNPTKFRIFEDGKWRDPNANEMTILPNRVANTIEERESHIDKEQLYGFIIVDDERGLMIFDPSQSSRARGRACRDGFHPDERAHIFWRVGYPIPVDIPPGTSIEKMKRELSTQTKLENENDIEEIRYLYRYYLWRKDKSLTSSNECQILSEWMEDEGLVVYR